MRAQTNIATLKVVAVCGQMFQLLSGLSNKDVHLYGSH